MGEEGPKFVKARRAFATAAEEAEFEAALEAVPLFAARDPTAENGAYRALQNLLYETDDGAELAPDALADHFRAKGNEYFRAGGDREALQYYSRAIAVEGCENGTNRALCYANRAAVHLRLGNDGHALEDARAALALDADCLKAHYRAAKALLALRRPLEAREHCEAGMAKALALLRGKDERVLKEWVALRADIAAEAARQETAAAERLAAAAKTATFAEAPAAAELARRGVATAAPAVDLAELEAQSGGGALRARLLKDGRLSLPVVVVFDEPGVMDVVGQLAEDVPLGDLLAEVLHPPPPWDRAGHYASPRDVEMYVELRDDRLLRVRPTTPLARVLAHPEFVLRGVPLLHLISRKSRAFRTSFFQRHGITG